MRPALSALLSLALVGCTVGPDYAPPKATISDTWLEPAAPGSLDPRWWASFGDAQLVALVERALASSPDLREAEARLAEARAGRDAARGGALPQAEAKGSATHTVLSENGQLPIGNLPGFARSFPLYDLGFDANWEIDFWGRNRRQVEVADARVDAAQWGQRDVMVMLLAELARNYVELRRAQADLAAADERLAALTELARLTRLRFAAGEADRIAAEDAEGQRAAASAAKARIEAEAASAAYAIAVLVGEAPEALVPGLRQPAPIPAPPETIANGVRSELLERRPDVRRAERELAAATADIGVATADLFPRFSLIGSVGQQARSVSDLASGDSTRLAIGPGFSWPVFSGGRIRAQIRGADARAQGAAARYDKAVVTALSDSESAANRFAQASLAARDAADAAARADRAYALAEMRTTRGEADRLTLMNARITRVQARQQLADANGARATAAIALFKALGGGWQQTP
ncbi:efflux transporter outer membrane subunit [Novosphingobium album (ex Liu et al. 2023)]|uniref:TolC family protein n=1 Tax=Novosphingobium album (ex Liu et al. 2023) TaxID=3031130 RepID=A0ABT5WR89_9SPHN|nr:TolC family protein [Novosphingobium album (ex Liu et al. 2023)]MDE8652566.1 TolC family protein [Novosphingobium album (ex Liu et al. 2023)]